MTLPPSILNFLAGLFAGAGINMLTSVATAPAETSTTAIVIDSAVWVLAAASTTWVAHLVETMNKDIEAKLEDDFDPDEERGVRRMARAAVGTRLRLATVAACSSVVVGVLFLPPLFPLP